MAILITFLLRIGYKTSLKKFANSRMDRIITTFCGQMNKNK